jgi:hypothetical protein
MEERLVEMADSEKKDVGEMEERKIERDGGGRDRKINRETGCSELLIWVPYPKSWWPGNLHRSLATPVKFTCHHVNLGARGHMTAHHLSQPLINLAQGWDQLRSCLLKIA